MISNYWQCGKSVTVSGGLILVYHSSSPGSLAALVPWFRKMSASQKEGKKCKKKKKKTPEVLKYVRFDLL